MTPKQQQAIDLFRIAGAYRIPIINKNIKDKIFSCNELLKLIQNEEIEHKEIINYKPVFRDFIDIASEIEMFEDEKLVKFVPVIEFTKAITKKQHAIHKDKVEFKQPEPYIYKIKKFGAVSETTQKLLDNSTDENLKKYNPREDWKKHAEIEKQFEVIEVKDKNSYETVKIERYARTNEIIVSGSMIYCLNLQQAQSLTNYFMSLGFLMLPHIYRKRYFTYTEVAHLGYNFKILGEK